MKLNPFVSLLLGVCLTFAAGGARAQTDGAGADTAMDASVEDEAANQAAAEATAEIVEDLEWGDYTVKAYTLTFWGGSFSGATYLDNPPLGPRTVLTEGAGHIIGYDGEVLEESTARYQDFYDAARKEIKSGESFGGRIGIYIADDFHLDLSASVASGAAVTTMLYTEDPVNAPDNEVRVQVDEDPGFKAYRGGLALMYDAHAATILGIVPRLGFGLGGVINRYSRLEDKTALYLEGNFALTYEVFENFELVGQVDLTNFAYQVDELGYANMVNYTTFSIGASWFIDRVPAPVRAAHMAENQ